MVKDDRVPLMVLKEELVFLEAGAYEFAHKQDTSWRPPFFFEDSPTCFHKWRGSVGERNCADCLLIQFVPPEHRAKSAPCRHIPLNAAGQTIDYFYKSSTQPELEVALKDWLLVEIKELEQKSSRNITTPGKQHANVLR